MRKSISTVILLVIAQVSFAADSNAVAFQIGQILGFLVTIGVIVLIIWLIVKAVKKK